MMTSRTSFAIYLEESERRDLAVQLYKLVQAAKITSTKTMATDYRVVLALQQALREGGGY